MSRANSGARAWSRYVWTQELIALSSRSLRILQLRTHNIGKATSSRRLIVPLISNVFDLDI